MKWLNGWKHRRQRRKETDAIIERLNRIGGSMRYAVNLSDAKKAEKVLRLLHQELTEVEQNPEIEGLIYILRFFIADLHK